MLENLTEPRDRLIYAYGLLHGYHDRCEKDLILAIGLNEVMEIIGDVVMNTWITEKNK